MVPFFLDRSDPGGEVEGGCNTSLASWLLTYRVPHGSIFPMLFNIYIRIQDFDIAPVPDSDPIPRSQATPRLKVAQIQVAPLALS